MSKRASASEQSPAVSSEKLKLKLKCSFCRLPRAQQACATCQEPLCRSCIVDLPEESFSLQAETPEELKHASYCPRCYDAIVEPALTAYREVLEKAKNVHYWPKAYRGSIPVGKKAQRTVEVKGCGDREEALLRLGFMAAEQGYNGLVRGEIRGRKQITNGYTKMLWSASALPAKVDEGKVERSEFRELVYYGQGN